jgi:hypothetical protein
MIPVGSSNLLRARRPPKRRFDDRAWAHLYHLGRQRRGPDAVRRAGPADERRLAVGSIALAVSLKKAGRVPTAVAVGLPLTWVASIPLGSFGGALLAGAYWMAVAYLLANDALEQSAAQPARA